MTAKALAHVTSRGSAGGTHPTRLFTCSWCEDRGRSPVDFYVTTEVGAVSEHWCGMQVRWTGKGRTGMAVVHDPGTLRGYLLIAFSVVVAVITFVISGNLVWTILAPVAALFILKGIVMMLG